MNDEDKGRKTNTDRDLKPEEAHRADHAPRGAQGRPAAGLSGPGLGTSARSRVLDQTAKEPTREQSADPAKDSRPVFKETGDKEIDTHYRETHRMVSKDESERGVSGEGPRVSQSDYAKAFRQASAQTQSMQQSRRIDPD